MFLLFLLSPLVAMADDDGKKVSGIRAGYQSSGYFKNGDMLSGTDKYASFYVGLFRERKLIPLLHVGSGLEYFQNGAKIDDDNKMILHYLSVPIYAKVKVGPVFALTGFAPSFKVAEKQFLLGEKSTPSDKSNWFDIPFYLGGGLKILFISVEVRYHWGLLDVREGTMSQYFQLGGAISF